MQKFTFRIHLAKTGRLRFISHHDLMRTMERAIRRSGIPVEYSEGFNPRPRISYPTALALGIESLDEAVDIVLAVWKRPEEILTSLGRQLPSGLQVVSCDPVLRGKETSLEKVHYEVVFLESPAGGARVHPPSQETVQNLLAAKDAHIVRINPKGKRRIDIRPYVLEIKTDGERLLMTIKITNEGTARPEEVLQLLGLPDLPPDVSWRITKTSAVFRTPEPARPTPYRRRPRFTR